MPCTAVVSSSFGYWTTRRYANSSGMTNYHIGPHRTTSDNIGQHRTTSGHIGPHRTTWDHIGAHRTTSGHMGTHRATSNHAVGRELLVLIVRHRGTDTMGPILRLHKSSVCTASCRSVHAWAAENFRNNAVIKSLSAARCNSRTVLLTLPALRGDFVITDIKQNSCLCDAGAM